MKNNKLFLSLFFLFSISFYSYTENSIDSSQLLAKKARKKILKVYPKDSYPRTKCVAVVKSDGINVTMRCGYAIQQKKRGVPRKFFGMPPKKLKARLKQLRNRGYTCGPGTLYGYKSNNRYEYGQFFTAEADDDLLYEENLNDYVELKEDIPHLCER